MHRIIIDLTREPCPLAEFLADNRSDPEVWEAVRAALDNDSESIVFGGGASPVTLIAFTRA